MSWVTVASLTGIPSGELRQAEANGTELVLVHDEEGVRAFQGDCPHHHGPLGEGNLDEGQIVCPWHAWEFDCKTGVCSFNPHLRLKKYETRVEDGQILVDVP